MEDEAIILGRKKKTEGLIATREKWNEDARPTRQKESRKYLYGLKDEEIQRVLGRQGHKCPLCEIGGLGITRPFHIDHTLGTGLIYDPILGKIKSGK